MNSEKTAICNAFAKASLGYDSIATIQQQAALDLATFILNFISPQIPQTAIDLGCGTGFLAKALRFHYPDLQLTLNDFSPKMIRKALSNHNHLDLPRIEELEGDIEKITTNRRWDLVASNCAWQWLENPQRALSNWTSRSTDLALSIPLEGSFPEWKAIHSSLSLPLRLRKLPSLKEIQLWSQSTDLAYFEIQENTYTQTLNSPLDFARQLKATGASIPHSETPISSLRKIQRLNSNPFTVTWNIAFLACHSRSPRL